MLSDSRVQATLPTTDLDRAKAFYGDVLGLEMIGDHGTAAMYGGAGGTRFMVSTSPTEARAGHTQMSFEVADIDAEVAALVERGVRFEDYDLPGFTTVDHIADVAAGRAAWFADPDGNLLALIQFG